MHDVKSYYLKSNNLNTEEQPAIVPKKGSKDSLADGQPDGFYVITQKVKHECASVHIVKQQTATF